MCNLIGIFGGTFDPPHRGHIQVAREIMDILHLKKVYLMPNFIPPHKKPAQASDQDRLAMVELLCSQNPGFDFLDHEIKRACTSYLSETMYQLKDDPNLAEQHLFFIIGADSLITLHTWHDPATIFKYCNIAVASRPGFDPNLAHPSIRARIVDRSQLDLKQNGQILLIPTSLIPVSSTILRQRPELITEQTVDPAVLSYIKEHQLYHAV